MNKTDVEIYTKFWCGYCRMAMTLLDNNNIEYVQIDVTADEQKEREMNQRSGRHTVPQIFITDISIGGFTYLVNLCATTDIKAHVSDLANQA